MNYLDALIGETEPKTPGPPVDGDTRVDQILDQTEQPTPDPKLQKVLDATEPRTRTSGPSPDQMRLYDYAQRHSPSGNPKAWAQQADSWIQQYPGKNADEIRGLLDTGPAPPAQTTGTAEVGGAGPVVFHWGAPAPVNPGKPVQTMVPVPGVTQKPRKPGDLATATFRSATAGFLKGVFGPVGTILPDVWDKISVYGQDANAALQGYVNSGDAISQAVQTASPGVKALLAGAPGMAGELAGSLVPTLPIGSVARAATDTRFVKTLLKNRFVRGAARIGAEATALTAASQVDDGQSHAAKIGDLALQMGAMELGFGFFARANKDELGKAYKGVVQQVADKLGRTTEQVEQDLAAARSGPGMGKTDPALAEAVEKATHDAGQYYVPLGINTRQGYDAWMRRVLPPLESVKADPALAVANKNYGVRFTILKDGQPVPGYEWVNGVKQPAPYFHIHSDTSNPPFFSAEVRKIRKAMQMYVETAEQAIASGDPTAAVPNFQVTDVRTGYNGSRSRFYGLMFGTDPVPPSRPAPTYPGAAPVNSWAERGGVPPVGSTQTVVDPGAAPARVTVVGVPQAPLGPRGPLEPPQMPMLAPTEDPGAVLGVAGKSPERQKYESLVARVQQLQNSRAPAALAERKALTPQIVAARKAMDAAERAGDTELGSLQARFEALERRNTKFSRNPLTDVERGEMWSLANQVGVKRRALAEQGVALTPLMAKPETTEPVENVAGVTRSTLQPAPGHVVVRMPDGTDKEVSLAQIPVQLQVAGQKADMGPWLPHPDGQPRNMLVHTNETDPARQLSVEPWGSAMNPRVNSFRSGHFYTPDYDANNGHDPRAFIGPNGLTISVTPGERLWEMPQFGKSGDFGPQDSAQFTQARQKPPMAGGRYSGGAKSATGEGLIPMDNTSDLSKELVRVKTHKATSASRLENGRMKNLEEVEQRIESNRIAYDQASNLGQGTFANQAEPGDKSGSPFPGLTAKQLTEHRLAFGPTPVGEGAVDVAAPRPLNQPQAFRAGLGGYQWNPETRTMEPVYGAPLRETMQVQQPPPEPTPVIPEGMTVKRGGLQYARGVRHSTTKFEEDLSMELPEAYGIGPDFVGHPEMAQGIKAARILMSKGVDRETPVFFRAAWDTHKNVDGGHQWTLGQLADYEPRQMSMTRLFDEAAPRGIKATPQGRGVILRADDGSWERKFDTQLEAADFVLRQPTGNVGLQRLEDPIEAQLGLGRGRMMDPDKDQSLFVNASLQDVATQELMQGKRAAVTMYTRDPKAVRESLASMEQMAKLPQGTLQALPVTGAWGTRGSARTTMVVYNKAAVQMMRNGLETQLAKLGVTREMTAEQALSLLAQKPWGLEAFAAGGRNPLDAILYTWARERGLREVWEQGRFNSDTMGLYRTFTPDVAETSGFNKPLGTPSVASADPSAGLGPMGPAGPLRPPAGPQSMPTDGPAGLGGEEWPRPQGVDLNEVIGESFPEGTRMHPGDGTPPITEPEPEWEILSGRDPWERAQRVGVTQESGVLGKLSRFFRVPEELMKDWEAKSGVPYWTWYNNIEGARNKLEANFNGFKHNVTQLFLGTNADERIGANLLLEAKHANDPNYQTLLEGSTPRSVALADASEQIWRKWLTGTYGYTEDQVNQFFGEMWQLRKSDGDWADYVSHKGAIPDLMTTLSRQFRSGVALSDGREQDLYRVMMRLGRAISNEKDLKPTWNSVKAQITARQLSGEVTRDNMMYFSRYMSEVVHMPDHMAASLTRMAQQISDRLAGRPMLKWAANEDFVQMLVGANYFANMAWNPGLVMRNMLQTLQTSTGLGMKAYKAGVEAALRWKNVPEFEEELIARGILTRDIRNQTYNEVQHAMDAMQGMEGGPAKTLWQKVEPTYSRYKELGTRTYKDADNINRVVAYYAQHSASMAAGERYLAGDIDFPGYMKESMADMRTPKGGAMERALEQMLREGNNDGAAAIVATDYMRATQFSYRRGTQPYWMMNTPGRLLGQYGTWPAYFVEHLRNMVLRGSLENRMKVATRWATTNYVMYEVAKEAFGVDAGRWLFFAPMGYTGGPLAQAGYDAAKTFNAAVAGSKDPTDAIAAARLKGAWTQLVPGVPVGGLRHTWDAIDAISQEDIPTAIKRFLGMPPAQP